MLRASAASSMNSDARPAYCQRRSAAPTMMSATGSQNETRERAGGCGLVVGRGETTFAVIGSSLLARSHCPVRRSPTEGRGAVQ